MLFGHQACCLARLQGIKPCADLKDVLERLPRMTNQEAQH